MKLKLALLLCLFIASHCLGQSGDFYDKVLRDQGNHSFFIAVDVVSSEYTGRVIIQNGDLLYFLNQTKGLDAEGYRAFMRAQLSNKTRLNIGDARLSKWGFIKVVDVGSVRKQASKGIEEFIRHYFRGRVIKDGIGDEMRNAIINRLFEWGIASKTDDETGYLVVYR